MTDRELKMEARQRVIRSIVERHPRHSIKLIMADLFQDHGIICSTRTVVQDLHRMGFQKRWTLVNNRQ